MMLKEMMPELQSLIQPKGNGCHPVHSKWDDLLFSFLHPPRREHLEETLMAEGGRIGLLWLHAENFFAFQKIYGDEIARYILEFMDQSLQKAAGDVLKPANLLYTEHMEAGRFAILFYKPGLSLEEMPDLAMSLRLTVRNTVNQTVQKLVGQRMSFCVGYSLLKHHNGAALESALYNAICDAREVACGSLDFDKLQLLEEFRKIVAIPELSMVYQPIVDFRSGEILGWESLARGPKGSYFRSPLALFDFAEEVGSVFSLEKVCREQAIRHLGTFAPAQKLFLNIHPRTLVDPSFSPGETLGLLEKYGLSPHNVVFEITERHSINEFTLFHRTLEHYRQQGFLVAIDDVGTGYSGLGSIAEIRPNFIKVDMSLIRGIDTNPVKRALLETLVAFADKIGSGVIAEGIETETEMSCLVSMGVHFGQGYHLGKPAFPKAQPLVNLPVQISLRNRHNGEWKCSIPVMQLVEPALQVDTQTEVREVKRILEAGAPISGLVVVEEQRPLGLVMSHHLNRQLGTYYGVALYYQRSITLLMDCSPLIVEGGTPVEVVAEMSMKRETFKIYDHIIVTENGRLAGIISVQKMLDTLAKVQVEMAKGANPLSGLPGNLAIEQEIERRCRVRKPMSMIYVDLDHFKMFNDHYGFKAGDAVLLLLARILNWTVKRHGTGDDFIGHVGGDDYVIITHPDRSERLSNAVVRCFKRLVPYHYNTDDRARGYVLGKDRSGREGEFPFVSVSLAIVDCRDSWDFHEVERRAADMKCYAKTLPGNKYVRDRRVGSR